MLARAIALVTLVWTLPAAGQQAPAQQEAQPASEAPAADAPPAAPALPAPPATDATAPAARGDEISLEEWNRDDWMLLKPQLVKLDLGGYYRLRGDLLHRMNLDNNVLLEDDSVSPRYPSQPGGKKKTITTSNMRLRLEPRINVSDQIQIVTTFDLLDNVVLGSSAEGYGTGGGSDDVLSGSQQPTVRGGNSRVEAVQLKRLYARATAMNEQLELRVGRMPDHWGLGMMTNSGDCLDCDYGHVTDRIAVAFKIGEHVFSPMYDWMATGPTSVPFDVAGVQAVDSVTKDDVNRFSLRIVRADNADDIEDRILRGEMVLNYGWWNSLKTQDAGLSSAYYENYHGSDTVEVPPATAGQTAQTLTPADSYQRRDALIYTSDAYFRFYRGNLRLAGEAAVHWGAFRDARLSDVQAAPKTRIYQLGGALEASYRFGQSGRRAELSLKSGGASGDSREGFGALGAAGTQRGGSDHAIENFQFSPDYHVDLLLFRRLLGTVTDAWYVRPSFDYQFSPQITGNLAAIYSQAIFKRSTPGGTSRLGLELDAEITYGTSLGIGGSPLQASLAYGLLWPFDALKNLHSTGAKNPKIAQALQMRLYFVF